jgi:hypothetical protein
MLKPWILAGRGVEQGGELPKLVTIQTEKNRSSTTDGALSQADSSMKSERFLPKSVAA